MKSNIEKNNPSMSNIQAQKIDFKKMEIGNILWILIGISLALFSLFIAYNALFDLYIPWTFLILSVITGSAFSYYLFQKRLRIHWGLAAGIVLFVLVFFSVFIWEKIFLNFSPQGSLFTVYLFWDSFKKIFIALLLTFFSTFISIKRKDALYLVIMLLILFTFPLAISIFDGTFFWRWEQGFIAFAWFVFFIFSLSVVLFRPQKKYIWPRAKGPLSTLMIIGLVIVLLGLASFYLFFLRPQQTLSGGLQVSGDHFRFNPFVKLEPHVSLSYERLMVVEMSQGKHIRHFLLSKYNGKGQFLKEENPWEKSEPPMYREKSIKEWRRGSSSKKNDIEMSQDSLRSLYPQKYFIKKMAPNVNLSVNKGQHITPLENKTPRQFTSIFSVQSLIYNKKTQLKKKPVKLNAKGKRRAIEFYEYYTKLGENDFSKRVKLLTGNIVKPNQGPLQKVKSIQKYLFNNYTYSLTPGGENIENRLEHFMFTGKKGYCTYFAFSFAVMTRSVGIPARVAVGFFPDSRFRKFNYWWILGAQAHTWIEVYFDQWGWITFDVPTSNPFSSMPGARAMNIQDELKMDLAAIEKNFGSKVLKDYEKKVRDAKRKKTHKKWIRFSSYSFFVFLGFVAWFCFQNYRFLLPIALFPRKRFYFIFRHISWTLARYRLGRIPGEGWTAWSNRSLSPFMAQMMNRIEQNWERILKEKSNEGVKKETEDLLKDLKKEVSGLISKKAFRDKVVAFFSFGVWLRNV